MCMLTRVIGDWGLGVIECSAWPCRDIRPALEKHREIDSDYIFVLFCICDISLDV